MEVKLKAQDKIKVGNAKDLFGIMKRVLMRDNKIDQEKEHFWIVSMNNAGYIINIDLISLGTSSFTLVEPMNVFRIAITKGAVRVIALHNHPSGELIPSSFDKDLTDRLIQVGLIVNVPLIDHLIISTKHYVSFAKMGLMDELAKSTKYVPPYILIERIRAEEMAIRNAVLKEKEKTEKEREKLEKAWTKAEKAWAKAEKEKAKAETAKTKAETAKNKAEQEKTKAEQEKTKAEQEKTKAEQEKTKAEQEKTKAEQERDQVKYKMAYALYGKNVPINEIAEMMNSTLEEVKALLGDVVRDN